MFKNIFPIFENKIDIKYREFIIIYYFSNKNFICEKEIKLKLIIEIEFI